LIVRSVANGLELITQPDHAQLARRIMERCAPLLVEPRRDAILHAVAEHDNGWAEEDAAPTLDSASGGICDFISLPLGARHAVWPRGVSRLRRDPWAAALVAHHGATVYDRFRADAAWAGFFQQMEAMRTEMMAAAGRPLEALVSDYAFLRLGDLISLAFCTRAEEEQRYANWTIVRAGDRVVVSPDAFGGAAVPFEISARTIDAQRFGSDADLRDALARAPTVTLRGEVAATS
jgi:hypothetical protein